jgi:hypothetical protein
MQAKELSTQSEPERLYWNEISFSGSFLVYLRL